MANRKLRVAAQVSGKTRDLLLRMVKPNLPNVFCQNITYAYGIPEDYTFPAGRLKAIIRGVHRTQEHEALVCTVDGQTHRPDGILFHITLSTAEGIPPAAASIIDLAAVEDIAPIEIEVVFEKGHAFVTKPQALEKLAA